MATTAERIKLAMELRGLKQADLIRKTGINSGAMSCYITGRYLPKQNNIYLMAKALNVDEAWLMGKDVPMERKNDTLSPGDEEFIRLYQNATPEMRKAAVAVLKSGLPSHEPPE